MFWILQYPAVQLLLVLWILQLIYTAYATMTGKFDDRIKPFIIILLFVTMYSTVDISKNWLGTPSFTDSEVVGILDGYDKITVDNKPMFAIMATTKSGPFMFVIPYEKQTEKDLGDSMKKRADTGKQTMIRKRSSKQLELAKEGQDGKPGKGKPGGKGGPTSGFDSSETEFYDFTDQLLIPKHDPNEK